MPSSSHYNAEIFYEDELLRINLFVVYQIYELKQSQKIKKNGEIGYEGSLANIETQSKYSAFIELVQPLNSGSECSDQNMKI